jgi:hypothetical protein
MHPALWKLCRLRVRARFRRWGRGLKSVRGVILTFVGLVLFACGMGSVAAQGFLQERADASVVQTNLSLGLLAMCLLNLLFSGEGKAIVFSPAELDFLFPGPFRRRDLLIYKLLGTIGTAALMGLIFATGFLRYVTWWVAGFVGIFAAYLFILLFDMTLAMTVQWIGALAYNRSRKLIVLAAAILIAVALLPAARQARTQGLDGFVAGLQSSPAGQVVLAPFNVFSRAVTAPRLWPELPLWGGLALGIDLVLIGLVLRLDASYEEASYAASQKRYEKLQRARTGGGPVMMTARWRLPRFPRLGGAGTVARRQALHLLRSSPRLLLVLALMSIGFWPMMFFNEADRSIAPIGLAVLGWVTMMLVMVFPFGLRGDLDHIDWFKTLPLRPLAVVVGEMLPVTFFIAALNGVALAGLLVADGDHRGLVAAAAVLDLPVVAVAVAGETLLFLAFPFRQMPGGQDPQLMARMMLLMTFRMVALLIVAIIAGGVGLAGYLLAGWPGAIVAAGATLLVLAAILLWLAAVLFQRFDVSVDLPA